MPNARSETAGLRERAHLKKHDAFAYAGVFHPSLLTVRRAPGAMLRSGHSAVNEAISVRALGKLAAWGPSIQQTSPGSLPPSSHPNVTAGAGGSPHPVTDRRWRNDAPAPAAFGRNVPEAGHGP